jgi:glycosyltransferase involved in cell wall biosynthesis
MKKILLHVVPKNINAGPINVAEDIVSGLKDVDEDARLVYLKSSDQYSFFRILKVAYEMISDERITVIHSHGIIPDVFCFIISLLSNKVWVSTVHIDPEEDLKFIYPRFYKVICNFWMSVLRRATRVVVLTKHVKNKIRLSNAVTILNSRRLNIEEFIGNKESYVPPDCITLGFCGALIERKNILRLVEEFRFVTDSRLIIVGDGPLKNNLVDNLQKIDNKHIRYLGFKNNLDSFWSEIDILILPSFAEGVPLVAIEALAHGKPLILLNLDNYAEVFYSSECFFIDDLNEKSINLAIDTIMANYTEYSAGARQAYAERFSYEDWISSYKDIYSQGKGVGNET